MKEDFLHYVWKFQKFLHHRLKTVQGEPLHVTVVGFPNQHDGPDFLNAQVVIGSLKWAGSIELHSKSSDWYRHQHHRDPAYDNVILHVVWEDDVEGCLEDGRSLPTLVLNTIISPTSIKQFEQRLLSLANFIPCEKNIHTFPTSLFTLWKQRLYIERLEEKSKGIQQLLKEEKNDWEAVLFMLLAQNFGLNVNGASFMAIAKSIPFKIIRKLQQRAFSLEAIFLGQAGLLKADHVLSYVRDLWKEFLFIQRKFSLPQYQGQSIRFKRLRPHKFPTIRLVQLAQLYTNTTNVFSRIFQGDQLSTQWMKSNGVSPFWETHYTFDRSAKKSRKSLTSSFIDLLTINTFIPLYFCFQKAKGWDPSDKVIHLMQSIKPEKNTVVQSFHALEVEVTSALDTQALLQLKKAHCSLKKCLLCPVGVYLLHPTAKQ